jgi:hypothetical protein
MLKSDILLSSFAISVFLIIYYVAVGFFPVFFETAFGYSQSPANTLGDWFWAFDAAGLLLIGALSVRLRVRKPFMVFGAVSSIVFTTIFALDAAHPASITAVDKQFLTITAPAALGAANLAALAHPTPALGAALKTLTVNGPPVASAAAHSPRQWRTFFFIGVGGEVVFIPLILLMAGFWDPRKAKLAEQEHERWLAAEMARIGH